MVLKNNEDVFLLRYARRILRHNPDVTIQVIDLSRVIETNVRAFELIDTLQSQYTQQFKVSKITKLHSGMISKFSFMMISYAGWQRLLTDQCKALNDIPSTLIINKKKSRFSLNNPSENQVSDEISDYSDV